MKYLIIIVLLVSSGCKNLPQSASNTTGAIDTSVLKIWNDYSNANPELKDEQIPEAEFFHNNKEDANRLAALTLVGKKKAASGLLSLYKKYEVPLPKVGDKQIITNFSGKAKAIIENTSVEIVPFNKVSKAYAELDMATDIAPLEKWRTAHWEFFENFLKESGEKPTQEMEIVCVRFRTIWTEKN